MQKMLTLDDWSNDIYLCDFLKVGDVIDDAFYQHLLNSAPPQYHQNGLFQMGESVDSIENEDGKMQPTYMTFTRSYEGGWKYEGQCFNREWMNRNPKLENNQNDKNIEDDFDEREM